MNNYNSKQYSLNKLSQNDYLPIDLKKIRYHINAHDTDPDEYIEDIFKAACEVAEEKMSRSIIWTKWELIHERPDIILERPPIQKIISVQAKCKRRWADLDIDDEDVVEQCFMNNGSRKIKVVNWQEGQRVRIVYHAGHTTDDSLEQVYKLSSATRQYVLNLCISLYSGQTKSVSSVENELIESYRSWSFL